MLKFIEKQARYIYKGIPDYIRCSKVYRDEYNFLKHSQWWTKDKQDEYQMLQISKLLVHAYENVSYYTRVFDERGLKPKDIQNFNDLKQLPILTKEIIQNNLDDLTAKNIKRSKLEYITTGGTTGLPMGFYRDKKLDKAKEWAFISNLWDRVGYNVKKINRNVILRGNIPENGLYEYKGRDLILSSFQITKENLDHYIELIEDFNPDFIQAYPSSIHLVAKYILRNNMKIKLCALKCILCSSENLYDNQRMDIMQAFGARVVSFYGHTEHACLAGECEKSSYFHLQSEYGYTEIINAFGQEVHVEDEVGEMVVTGFNNYVTPFIRYKTGDLVVNTNKKCECGRSYKLIKKIEGRVQDYFIDKNNESATFIYQDVPLWHVMDKINEYQYEQNEIGKVILKINAKDDFNDEDKRKIVKEFSRYYPKIEIKIDFNKEIYRTKRGKFKFLIQNLNITKNLI